MLQLTDPSTGEPLGEGVVKDYSVIVPMLERAVQERGVKISIGPREPGKLFLQWGVTVGSPLAMTEEEVATFRRQTISEADRLADKNGMSRFDY